MSKTKIKQQRELPGESQFLMRSLSRFAWRLSVVLAAARYPALTLEAARREMRQAAEQSEGHIISGQRGYKLTRKATEGEARHAIAWLRSQARKTEKRAADIEAVWEHYHAS